jgi:peptidoglycan/LPS O-acetylase OafA/YrhL
MTGTLPALRRSAPETGPALFEDGPRFRPEIQALRAVAVLAVVLFHLSPTNVPGGFVGVDVFFVISGFLITSHLLRDTVRNGRPPLATFWLRRVRRLLPAAFVVLAVTLVTVLIAVPQTLWQQFLREIIGSTLYVENWLLANSAVDYFAEGDQTSPVQHYWSLSTEEQFYLVWPLLLTLLIVVGRAKTVRVRRLILVSGMGAVLAASLLYSALIAHESYGYFSTFTHAWEFAAGALLAVYAAAIARRLEAWPVPGAALAWLGYALIAVSIFVFTGDTPFPGVAALIPVAGTLAVIAAGTSERRFGPDAIARTRVVQGIGDVSYSLYLWHWPPIILLPFVTGHPLTHLEKAAILVAAFGLAWLTKRYVEDRFRGGALERRDRVRTSVALVAGMGIMTAAALAPIVVLDVQQRAAIAALAELRADPCFGAGSVIDASCEPNNTVTPLIGAQFAAEDTPNNWRGVPYQDCDPVVPGVPQCVFGPPDARTTIAVVGDSHVEHLLPAIAAAADEHGWRVKLMWYAGCRAATPTYADVLADDDLRIESDPECLAWKDRVAQVVVDDPDVDLVLTTSGSRPLVEHIPDEAGLETVAAAFTGMWDRLASGGAPVLVVRDTPLAPEKVPDCIAAADTDVNPCALPREQALVRDPIDVAIAAGLPRGVDVVDLTDTMCDRSTCRFVVGGVITHYDAGHLSATFSRTLAPLLGSAIEERLGER